jgi:hypothetical protein
VDVFAAIASNSGDIVVCTDICHVISFTRCGGILALIQPKRVARIMLLYL